MADDEGSRYSTSTKCNNLIVRKCNSDNSVNDIIGKNTDTSSLQPHVDTAAGLNSGSYQYHQPRLSLEDLRERNTYHDNRFPVNRLSVDITCYGRYAPSIRRPTKTAGDIASNVAQSRRWSEQNYLEIVASGPLSLGATGRDSEYLQVIQGGDERPLQDHFVPIYRDAEDIVAAASSVASQSAERLSRVTDESVYADIPTESLYLETPPYSTSWRRR